MLLNRHVKLINQSKAVIGSFLNLVDSPCISLSFGKDSLVMLDMIYSFGKIPCYFLKSEESYLMYNFEEVIEYYKAELDIELNVIDTNRLTESDFNWEKARKSGNKDFDILDKMSSYHDGVFIGLRMEESKGRRITLLRSKKDNYVHEYKNGLRRGRKRCCPLAEWKTQDVLNYVQHFGLKILDVYSEGEHIRTTARLTGDSTRSNSLYWIKKNKPENWNKLIRILPELRGIT